MTPVYCILTGKPLKRTASVSARAVDLCGSHEIENVAIIGAGALAKAHIELLAKRLPDLREFRVYDLEAERVASLGQSLAHTLEPRNIAFKPVTSAAEA